MGPKREFHWPIRLFLYLLFGLVVLVLLESWGEASDNVPAALGWAWVVLTVVTYDVMVEHLPFLPTGKVLDLLLIVTGASIYALFQTAVMLLAMRGFTLIHPLLDDPVLWMAGAMLSLSAIFLQLFRYR